MKRALYERDYTIRQLQRENNDLRRQLAVTQSYNATPPPAAAAHHSSNVDKGEHHERSKSSLPDSMLDGACRSRNNATTDTRYNRTWLPPPERYNSYDETMRPSTSSLSSTLRSSPLRDEDENTFESAAAAESARDGLAYPGYPGFTPGTKFVAELTKFMKIDHGHNVPLSVIIDKHWDKLKLHMREGTNSYY